MGNKKKIFGIISGVVMLLIVSIGLSFAYFTATLSGSETGTTITVSGGTMKLVFDGGNNITVSNIFPGAGAVATKNFTVTGNNTTELEMPYTINLVVDSNTFVTDALSYTLTSVNTSSSGTSVPSISVNTGIANGAGTHLLGNGTHTEGTGKIHTYTLNIYFLSTDQDQNANQGKTFAAHIGIESGEVETIPYCDTNNCAELYHAILSQEGGASLIEAKGNPNFAANVTSADTGLYAAEDEYGTSYYYRGDKYLLNNNLIFAGFQWKIVRINGDGSIRIVYNGECPGGECIINSTGAGTQIANSSPITQGNTTETATTFAWNIDNYEDAKYVGYMYGGANGAISTSRVTDKSLGGYNQSTNAVYNETSSNAKVQLELWYANNIVNQGVNITSKIVDNLFCNDRQLRSEVGGSTGGTGFGQSPTYYAANYRLAINKTPTLKCGLQNDRFTVSDITVGNGALEYPVGLLSIDEVSMSGLVYDTENLTNYLYTNQTYYTFSPNGFHFGYAAVWFMFLYGRFIFNGLVSNDGGLRPTISLDSGIIISGEGSESNPYKVE